MKYELGDIVLVYRGQRSNFFEVHHIEDDGRAWINNGHVQLVMEEEKTKLICKGKNRMDDKVPFTPFFR